MRATKNPAAANELLLRAQEYLDTKEPREQGPNIIHVSDIVQCRRKSWMERRLESYPVTPPSPKNLATLLLGTAHHLVLKAGRPEVPVRFKFSNGTDLVGHIDAVNCPYDSPVEFKTTRSSSNKKIGDMQHYLEQIATYVLLYHGEPGGQLFVWHVLGDWKGSKLAELIAWEIGFSED